jgi:hypothetical protein
VKLLFPAVLLFLAGCAGAPPGPPDFFARQDQFAADRARQTTRVDLEDTAEACAQVVAVLLDLHCSLVEVDHRLGLVSARSNPHTIPPVSAAPPAPNRRSCAGHSVTVSVAPSGRDQLAVRAVFKPGDPRAEETFGRLLRKSVALSTPGEGR